MLGPCSDLWTSVLPQLKNNTHVISGAGALFFALSGQKPDCAKNVRVARYSEWGGGELPAPRSRALLFFFSTSHQHLFALASRLAVAGLIRIFQYQVLAIFRPWSRWPYGQAFLGKNLVAALVTRFHRLELVRLRSFTLFEWHHFVAPAGGSFRADSLPSRFLSRIAPNNTAVLVIDQNQPVRPRR